MSKFLYDEVCRNCSKMITKSYSTSFSLGIRLFDKKLRGPIYGIYGFVRFADEIVDCFHDYKKKELLDLFEEETYRAIDAGISLNPVLHSFQEVVNQYNIDKDLIDAFLRSMEMDLDKTQYKSESYEEYIFGSAEVVGLMCLKVFTDGDEDQYQSLKDDAKALGSAFQKINFLRDLKSDFDDRGRVYFPGVEYESFTEDQKKEIEADIMQDFDAGLEGIKQLPRGCKLGVYIAYLYFRTLLNKIMELPVVKIKSERVRVRNLNKLYLLAKSSLKYKLGMI